MSAAGNSKKPGAGIKRTGPRQSARQQAAARFRRKTLKSPGRKPQDQKTANPPMPRTAQPDTGG